MKKSAKAGFLVFCERYLKKTKKLSGSEKFLRSNKKKVRRGVGGSDVLAWSGGAVALGNDCGKKEEWVFGKKKGKNWVMIGRETSKKPLKTKSA